MCLSVCLSLCVSLCVCLFVYVVLWGCIFFFCAISPLLPPSSFPPSSPSSLPPHRGETGHLEAVNIVYDPSKVLNLCVCGGGDNFFLFICFFFLFYSSRLLICHYCPFIGEILIPLVLFSFSLFPFFPF